MVLLTFKKAKGEISAKLASLANFRNSKIIGTTYSTTIGKNSFRN